MHIHSIHKYFHGMPRSIKSISEKSEGHYILKGTNSITLFLIFVEYDIYPFKEYGT